MISSNHKITKQLELLFNKRKEKEPILCECMNLSYDNKNMKWHDEDKEYCVSIFNGHFIFYDKNNKGVVDFVIPIISSIQSTENDDTIMLTGVYGVPVLCLINKNKFFLRVATRILIKQCNVSFQSLIETNQLKSNSSVLQITYLPLFGNSIQIIMLAHFYDPKRLQVPDFVYKSIKYLAMITETEGLFRLSGDSSEMEEIRELVNKGEEIIFPKYSIHSISNLLKYFFRSLPHGLIPQTNMHKMVERIQNTSRSETIQILKEEVHCLSLPVFTILSLLNELMIKILELSQMNKMTEKNLLICFSPSLKINGVLLQYLLFCSELYQ
ncbi:RhoGAP domain containing protein [Entamoeba histolytica HM-1:IMSS-B]|uniref:Rhogap domain containing protein n=5 Tax=Entamoeba histolytica TaxID=5759 RepID=A0A175JUP2_ENTHI|nr:RhoGAP domain containing protein [Entamoeba histolytica KU27]EMH76045.1 RhoGAP domain containing protein [Entamoeba histolytica HM-1:IMSS-B]EMS16746.1 RhoGAP domain containing protein [Entamoeba histolytica HM-3:IMSS]ENY64600.1 RhoGAP domain containing protein [Entamoeba histolytica HM-1:IMSS-A]GAT97158.1 rhogap domain containing protein [Entamoeba histolytica]